MRVNKWTLGLAAVGLVTLPAGIQAEENASPVLTSLAQTTISGYVNTSAHWNIGSGNANTPAYSFTQGKQDGFNLDVVKLSIARPLDEGQWSAGYQADLLFGPDANTLATQSNSSDGAGDFGVQQAFVALRAPIGNGFDMKVGVWDTIVGYEVFDAGSNPNYTRSWGYTIEPTQHTGVLGSYTVNEMVSFALGVANTFGPSINEKTWESGKSESYKTYMGSIALTAPEEMGFLEGSTLYAGIINGFDSGYGENRTHYYVGATIATPVESVKLGASYDYAGWHEDDDSGVGKHAYAIAGYISFQMTEKLSLHGRGDYLKLSQASALSERPTGSGNLVQSGIAEQVFSLTGTLQYDLWANVLSRLEVRWDHAAGGHPSDSYGGEDGSDDVPSTKEAVLVAANIIYNF